MALARSCQSLSFVVGRMQRNFHIRIRQICRKAHQLFAGRVDNEARLAFVIVAYLDAPPDKPDAAPRGGARRFSYLAHVSRLACRSAITTRVPTP